MLRIAITGGIACGKSQVGALFAANNVPVCDADELAHSVIRKGTGVNRRIIEEFGRGLVGPDGEIDRSVLGRIVFGDPERLQALNALVHPGVKVLWESWIRKQRGKAAVAVMIPLLYETGEEGRWGSVVCVSARESDQRKRLKARGLTVRDIKLRLAAQMPVWEKMERADHVIYNCGSRELLKEQTLRVLNELLERKHA